MSIYSLNGGGGGVGGGVTHSANLRVVWPVGQDVGDGLKRARTADGAEGPVVAAGQDQEEMCRHGSVVPGDSSV